MNSPTKAPPKPKPIDDAMAMQIYASTTDAIAKLATSADGTAQEQAQQFLVLFSEKVKPTDLKDKMPIEAYALIVQKAQEASKEVEANVEKSSIYTPKPEDYTKDTTDAIAAIKQAMAAVTFAKSAGPIGGSGARRLIDATVTAVKTKSDDRTAVNDFLMNLSIPNIENSTPDSARQAIELEARDAMNRIHSNKEFLVHPVSSQGYLLPTQLQQIEAAAAAALQGVTVAASKLIGVGGTVPTPKAPDDVSCSMSVLSWKETSDTFGRRVANTYVAVQVNVRNLNNKNEFLIHDIQVAIDTGVPVNALDQDANGDQTQRINQNKNLGRFQAGRDKLLVRAVAQRGQTEDRRNLAVNALEMIGAVAATGSVSAKGGDLKTAVAVFQGAFIPGFNKLFPDHTVEQLNHINDLVFSASSTSKVLVPIQGSVPLVTFIAERPIEELPFAWCGQKKGADHTGRDACDLDSPSGASMATAPRELPFGKWRALALEILQNRTFVVLGGVHIQEVQGTSKIANLNCPTFSSGEVDVSQTKDGIVSCSVTGNSLDKVSSVALEKGSEKIAGKIKAAADGNSATLQFDPVKLCSGDGNYSIYLVDNSSTETDSGQLIALKTQPLVTDVKGSASDGTLDMAKDPATLTLNGGHLDLVKDASLVDESGGLVHGTLQSSKAGGSSIQVNFTLSGLGATSGKTYHLKYSFWTPTTEIEAKTITVKTSGSPPAAPAAPTKKGGGG
ncbi:MAG TPA: hypothetical protein VKV95_08800 [Terriglobia bacterium]|nr:hypothetical protein [Terriglobia bacterium]